MSLTDQPTASNRWMTVSAWAGAIHVVFQAASLAQSAVLAILTAFAFRRSAIALSLLGVFGLVRGAIMIRALIAIASGSMPQPEPRVLFEYLVTIPIALLWIAGAVAVMRARRRFR
jgi:hypothetical protein